MDCAFLELEDSRWQHFLERSPHSPYHLPGYVELAASHEGGTPCAFWAKSGNFELLLPLLIQEIPEALCGASSYFDARTPYGCSSPLVYPLSRSVGTPNGMPDGCAAAAVSGLLQSCREGCAERRIVSVFASTCPLITLPRECFGKVGELVQRADNVYVDLTRPENEWWQRLRRAVRNQARALEEEGFHVEIDNLNQLPLFAELYNQSMARLNADPFYFFSIDYFEKLRRVKGLDVHLCSVLTPRNEVVFSVLNLHANGIIDAFLSGVDENYQALSVSKLAYVELIRWSKRQGYKLFNLGGGVGGDDDSLLFYKRGFSDKSAPFFTWQLVCREQDYVSFVNHSRDMQAAPAGSTFFPAYRSSRSPG